jgi:hypothetical protein
LVLDGSEWSASFHSYFIPWKEPPVPNGFQISCDFNYIHSFTEFQTKLHRSHSPKITDIDKRMLVSSPSSESKYEEVFAS